MKRSRNDLQTCALVDNCLAGQAPLNLNIQEMQQPVSHIKRRYPNTGNFTAGLQCDYLSLELV